MSIKPASGLDGWIYEHPEYRAIFAEHIAHIAPDVEKLTGLRVRLVDPDSPNEINYVNDASDDNNQHARFRIVPATNIEKVFIASGHSANTIESRLYSAVHFVPSEVEQVDGYILPNAEGSIGMAVCRINPQLPEGVVKALITECLVRGLGLPSKSDVGSVSAVGAWNERVSNYSRNEAETIREDALSNANTKGAPRGMPRNWKKSTDFKYPIDLINTHGLENGFSQYDKLVVSL